MISSEDLAAAPAALQVQHAREVEAAEGHSAQLPRFRCTGGWPGTPSRAPQTRAGITRQPRTIRGLDQQQDVFLKQSEKRRTVGEP